MVLDTSAVVAILLSETEAPAMIRASMRPGWPGSPTGGSGRGSENRAS